MDDSVTEKTSGDEEDLFLRMKTWFRADRDHSSDWRTDAEEDYDFVSGKQWKAEEEQTLRDQNRPPVVFNRVQPVIDVICGQEVANRQEVRFIPRTLNDGPLNERMTEAARWFRDLSDAEDEDSDAFRDAVICGMGWTETRYDADEDPEGKPIVERIDPLEMFWDCHARRANLVDARRMWRVKKMAREEARRLFPDADEAVLNAKWASSDDDKSEIGIEDRTAYNDEGDSVDGEEDKQVTIVECQWHEMEEIYLFPTPQGTVEATEEEALALKSMMPDVKPVQSKRRVYKRAFLGAKVLETGPAPCGKHFSWNCITGKRDRNKGTWYGVVRAMKDPQRWANKWLSQTMHILNTNAKGGIFAELDAFEDKKEAERTYARSDQITWVKRGGLGKIQPKQGVPVPAGFFDLMNFAVSSVRDTSGVSVEMIGAQEANQAASLEYQRRQTSMTILATLFDSLRRYRKLAGRVLLYIIQNDISPERLVRITSDNDPSFQPLSAEAQSADYDIIIDDAPTSPNQKEAAWQAIQQMLPIVGQMLTPQMWASVLEFSPLPASVSSKLRQSIEEAANQPQQPDPKTVAEQQKLQAQMEMKQAEMQLRQQELEMQQQLEMQKIQADMELKRYQIDQELALKREQIAAEVQIKAITGAPIQATSNVSIGGMPG